MKISRIYILLFVVPLVINSCKVAGLNLNRETPKKGYNYPKFKEKDYVKGELNEYRKSFDVKEYNIAIELLPEKKYIKGNVEIVFTALKSINRIQIDLFSNMKMDSIIWQGKKLQFSRKYNAVYVDFPQEINGSQNIVCYYQGKPVKAPRPPWEGGFVWKENEDNSPWIGVACELTGSSLWWPCKDHISDEPENGMSIDVTVPKGLVVVANGKQTLHESLENKERYVWKTNYPINVYNITLYAAKYEHFHNTYNGIKDTFDLDYYVLPQNLEKAKKSFKQVPQVISVYEDVFGPYPWPNDGYKLIESPFEGMEHQTAIAYGSGYKNGAFGIEMDYIIVHETAHEWFGNSISVPDYSDIFIHEGFATYAEALYVERMFGKDTADRYMRIYGLMIKNKNPIVGPKDVAFWDYHDTDPYLKGAWTLHGLRNIMNNDSLFFSVIKGFYLTNNKSIVTVKDFTNFVNEKTGQNYDWYFKQYLFKREVPCLEYYTIQNGTELEIFARWTDVDDDFVMPVKLTIDDIPVLINPTTQVQKFVIHDWENMSFDYDFAYYRLQKVKEFK